MKGLRGNFEMIIIGIFILVFLIWAVSKCNSSKAKLQQEAATEAMEDSLSQQATNPPATATPPATKDTTALQSNKAPQPIAPANTTQESPQGTKLYVTIDKLKIRKSPGLKGESLGELKLFDEVFYMNEVTDSLYTLNLGYEEAKEPYVKVKTKRGTIGWVYGAGVHYVKKKRSGVLE
jgi:hypothetical protein